MRNTKRIFGLIGYPLSHSFSQKYFTEKFNREKINDCSFNLYPISEISELPELLKKEQNLKGLSVTIPYKTQVISMMNELDETAEKTRAVNSIKIMRRNNKMILTGYNTDIFGFEKSLLKTSFNNIKKALILGTGGASLAVEWVLKKYNIDYKKVSRNPKNNNEINYSQITHKIIKDSFLIINSTPLGMYPKTDEYPDIPYSAITDKHILFDLTYNPEETLFLRKGKKQGAFIKNGLDMLHFQAEKSWEIWNTL